MGLDSHCIIVSELSGALLNIVFKYYGIDKENYPSYAGKMEFITLDINIFPKLLCPANIAKAKRVKN
jgi:hypothetical protein